MRYLWLVLLCGCVTPADQAAVTGIPRAGWIDVKFQGVADRSIDRARTTILIPALQGMVDGLKEQRAVSSVSVGVLVNEPVKAEEPAKEPEPITDQPDDVLTVRECTPTQCFGLFTIRRNQLQSLEVAAGGRGRKVTIVNVKRSVSVVKTKQDSPCGCPDCACPDCQCLRTKTVTVTRGYSPVVYESTPTYTTTYRTRWRPFGRWRR